jgi:hypothetical protein
MATDDKKPAPPPPSSGQMTAEQEARARAIVEEAKTQAKTDAAYKAATPRSMGTYQEPEKKARGGYVKAADGIAKRGRTRGKMV